MSHSASVQIFWDCSLKKKKKKTIYYQFNQSFDCELFIIRPNPDRSELLKRVWVWVTSLIDDVEGTVDDVVELECIVGLREALYV